MIFASDFSSFVWSANRSIGTAGDEFWMNFERINHG
jgi:hypothetical protein